METILPKHWHHSGRTEEESVCDCPDHRLLCQAAVTPARVTYSAGEGLSLEGAVNESVGMISANRCYYLDCQPLGRPRRWRRVARAQRSSRRDI